MGTSSPPIGDETVYRRALGTTTICSTRASRDEGGSVNAVHPPPLPTDPGYAGAPRPHVPLRIGREGAPPKQPRPRRNVEDDLIATWFPRLGAIALVAGAAFGYKLAVDRGLLAPLGRVALGIATGMAMLVIGEWTRRRRWNAFAQAITGGGIGLLTLVAWASYRIFSLIGAPEAFVLLAAVTVTGAVLAIVHDSEALLTLAAISGFLNPVVLGADVSRASAFWYVLVLDAGVIAVATKKRWRIVPLIASAGSWSTFVLTFHHVADSTALAYSTALFGMFTAVPMLSAYRRQSRPTDVEIALGLTNAVAYYTTAMSFLVPNTHAGRGGLTAAVAAAFAAFAVGSARSKDRGLAGIEGAIALVLATIAVPMGTTGVAIGLVWTIEAILLMLAGRSLSESSVRNAGLGVLLLALVDTLGWNFSFGTAYEPARLLFTVESLALVVQVAALYVAASVVRDSREVRAIGWIGANLLTLAWMSFEAHAHLLPRLGSPSGEQALAFSYSAIWGVYAAALLSVGVLTRRRGAITFAVVVFGVTIAKMVVNDLWLLSTAYRTIGFVGLGVLLMSSSLLYHRFRALLTAGGHERTNDPETTPAAAV
jgi:uncharacterized membrane protein